MSDIRDNNTFLNIIDTLENQHKLEESEIRHTLQRRYRNILKAYRKAEESEDLSKIEMIYQDLLEDYQSIYYYDNTLCQKLSSMFDMPNPLIWSDVSIKLRAFIDSQHALYITHLSPFERALKQEFEYRAKSRSIPLSQDIYVHFITLYRTHYFKWTQQLKSAEYFLICELSGDKVDYQNDEYINYIVSEATFANISSLNVNNYTLIFKQIQLYYQKQIDLLALEMNDETQGARAKEQAILGAYEERIVSIQHVIDFQSNQLVLLLDGMELMKEEPLQQSLKTYFQHCYDVTQDEELQQLLATQKEQFLEQIPANIVDATQIKIRNAYELLLLSNNSSEEIDIVKAYESAFISYTSQADSSANVMFLPINTKNTRATSIHPDFHRLDIVTVHGLAMQSNQAEDKLLSIQNDIEYIRATIQNYVNINNKNAEFALNDTTIDVSDTLVKYASVEQEVVSFYAYLVAKYYTFVALPQDPRIVKKPFVLYFDNYFTDFEQTLDYYQHYYDFSQSEITQSPYYIKMFNAVEGKLSIVHKNFSRELTMLEEEYINKRNELTQLHRLETHYDLEVMMLIDEFDRYAKIFIQTLQDDATQKEHHNQEIATLKQRFLQKEENESF